MWHFFEKEYVLTRKKSRILFLNLFSRLVLSLFWTTYRTPCPFSVLRMYRGLNRPFFSMFFPDNPTPHSHSLTDSHRPLQDCHLGIFQSSTCSTTTQHGYPSLLLLTHSHVHSFNQGAFIEHLPTLTLCQALDALWETTDDSWCPMKLNIQVVRVWPE